LATEQTTQIEDGSSRKVQSNQIKAKANNFDSKRSNNGLSNQSSRYQMKGRNNTDYRVPVFKPKVPDTNRQEYVD